MITKELKKTSIYIPDDLYEKVLKSGKRNDRTLSQEIRFILKEYFKKE